MKKLTYIPEHQQDCIKLQKQLADQGYECELASIESAWECYSSNLCAQWINLYNDPKENVACILKFLEEQEE